MDAVKNFGIVELSTGYDATATNIVLKTGDGVKLPDPVVDGQYNLVWYDYSNYSHPAEDPNVEIVRVTGPAGTGDTKTIIRAQEGTSASSKTNGGTMILGTTAKTITDIESEIDTDIATHTALPNAHHNQDHASRHTDGTDDIQDATAAQKGLVTAAQISKLDGIEAGATADQIASEVPNTPAGGIAATDVQAAINELDTEKESTSTSHAARHITGGGDTIADVVAAGNSGLMSGVDKTKLNGIEDGATADQTGAEIKTAYEAEPNAYTDAKDTKLAGIEDGATADQIASEVSNAPAGGIAATDVQAAINELDTEKQFKVDQNNIYYVGKHGSDLNSGKNIESAFLTFGAAITEANSQHPAADNKYVIKCDDGGIYAENLTIPSYIAIYGPYCEINGNIIVEDRSAFQVFSGYCETGIYISKTTGSSHATIIIRRIELGKSATALSCATGELNVNCSIIILENGIGIDSQSHEGININLRHINITGTGTALRQAGGTINITCETISDSGGHGMGIYLSSGGIINGQIGDIDCSVAYNINTSSVLNLLCSSISGTRTNTATANVITTDGNCFIGGNLELSGTVDGRDISTDGTKLDGIEAGATADQIASEVPNSPAGGIAATDVQAAINELDTEKESTSTSHAARHVTGGGDTIADVVAAGNSGLMPGVDKTKLNGIEDSADITDADNIASSIHGVAEITTPVDADELGLVDSAAANVLKKLTWSNIKATLKTYFDTLYSTISDLSTHASDTTTHGTTGDIVGTSDTQVLSNKSISDPLKVDNIDGYTNAEDVNIGNAIISDISAGINYAEFSHNARTGSSDYTLLSTNDGNTFINASTGHVIEFKINNVKFAKVDGDGLTIDSKLKLGHGTLTISSGGITPTRSYQALTSESGTTDTLSQIDGGQVGEILVLHPTYNHTITVNETGNIILSGTTYTMNSYRDTLMLIRNYTNDYWQELSRSDNA